MYRHPFLRPLDDSLARAESMSLKVHRSHTLEHTGIIPAATYFVNRCGLDDSVVELCAYWGISFYTISNRNSPN